MFQEDIVGVPEAIQTPLFLRYISYNLKVPRGGAELCLSLTLSQLVKTAIEEDADGVPSQIRVS